MYILFFFHILLACFIIYYFVLVPCRCPSLWEVRTIWKRPWTCWTEAPTWRASGSCCSLRSTNMWDTLGSHFNTPLHQHRYFTTKPNCVKNCSSNSHHCDIVEPQIEACLILQIQATSPSHHAPCKQVRIKSSQSTGDVSTVYQSSEPRGRHLSTGTTF